ncbi:MAG: shikimate kinase [Oscillospiraceae bacterium]
MKNIVLIGMPGSGKSAVGALLSRQLSRPFIDLDTLIEETASLTVSEIFEQWGEGAFRDLESALVLQSAQESGFVIATGGGVILREENMIALQKTGILVFLDRPLEQLARQNHAARPLLAGDSDKITTLYMERIALYRRWAQVTVSDAKSPSDAARQVAALCGELEEI